jgi:hypothetical protein
MSLSTLAKNQPTATSTSPEKPGVLVAKKHHLLVRWCHWLNAPLLLGLSGFTTTISGITPFLARRLSTTTIEQLRKMD